MPSSNAVENDKVGLQKQPESLQERGAGNRWRTQATEPIAELLPNEFIVDDNIHDSDTL